VCSLELIAEIDTLERFSSDKSSRSKIVGTLLYYLSLCIGAIIVFTIPVAAGCSGSVR
jgi:hypothetical protein